MKKWLLVVLAVLMTMSVAQAEEAAAPVTRERQVMIEGTEETIIETQYASGNGFLLWYDAEYLKPADFGEDAYDYFVDSDAVEGEESLVSVLLVASQAPTETAETFIDEATALYPPETVGEKRHQVLSNGLEYYVQDVAEGDTAYRFYAIKGPETLLCVTATMPLEALEGYGARIDAMIGTIAFAVE